MTPKVILVDIDGCLTADTAWTSEDCLRAKPRLDVIEKVNELYKENFIVLYTARRDHLIPATLEWCRRNNVHFQAISNLKVGAEIYIDDRCVNVEDFLERGLP